MDGYKIKIWHLLYLQRYIKLKNSVIILQKSKKFSVFSNKSGWKELNYGKLKYVFFFLYFTEVSHNIFTFSWLLFIFGSFKSKRVPQK